MSGLITELTEIFWTVPLYAAQSLKTVVLQCLQAYIFFVNTWQKASKTSVFDAFLLQKCRKRCGSGCRSDFDPHPDPLAEMCGKGERASERKLLSLRCSFCMRNFYLTCAMKLPIFSAALLCICRVAWV